MLKKSMLVLSLATILVAGCAQEKPKAQEQPLPQAKPPVQVEQKTTNANKPKIVGQTKLGKDIVNVEERTRKVKEVDGRIVEVKEYFEAGTNNQIYGFFPNDKPVETTQLKNEGKKVSKFKSK